MVAVPDGVCAGIHLAGQGNVAVQFGQIPIRVQPAGIRLKIHIGVAVVPQAEQQQERLDHQDQGGGNGKVGEGLFQTGQ